MPDMTQRDDAQSGDLSLSPADQRVLDALIEAGMDRARLPQALDGTATPQEQQRLDALTRLLTSLDDYPVEDAEPALLHATLARIDRHEDQIAERMRFDVAQEEHAPQRGFRIRVPDFISVAAVMLIAIGLFWPALASIRRQSLDAECANNLKQLGYGFSQYADDHNGALPYAMAGPMGAWDTVKNVLNLDPLVQGNYCQAGHLNCPGHEHHGSTGPSYSYRLFTPRGAQHWNTGRVTVILGDLNPLIEAARSGFPAPPLSMSANHGGRGQNVLISDGATMWLEQPLIGPADNIWMPNNAQILRPGQAPADDLDVFLAH
jgi:hypothetical protein